jgi:SRSO17 transposase
LIKVAGARWTIEECFQTGKNEAALDHYQVRLYPAWYRYITLSMLAMAFLAVMRASLAGAEPDNGPNGDQLIPVSANEIRRRAIVKTCG